jgi:uncharacterized protein YabE (DUF348 family)
VSLRTIIRNVRPASSESVESTGAGALAAVRRRPIALALPALLLLALLASAVAWNVTAKTVALSVDGETSEVDFRGDTVADVLAAADLEVGEHDLLVPSADTEVGDGDEVALRRGRPIKLVVDGVEKTVWVTATSVDEALDQMGLRQEGLALSASRSRSIPLDGLSLDVRTPKNVTIAVDGATTPLTTTAPTIGDALAGAGVQLGPLDRVTPAVGDAPTEGLAIVVARVATSEVVEEGAVPFGTERREDGSLTQGTTKVLQEGKNGAVRRTFSVTTVNGAVESKTLTNEVRTAEPVTRILAVGTKPKPAPAPAPAPGPRGSTGSASSLNWAALADCESGGNPRAVNPSGKYFGLYQFSLATWRSVGGSGNPIDNSPAEQTYRAQVLYNKAGAGQWPHCGKYLFS